MELQLQEGLGDEVRRRTLLRRRARARKAAARKSKASLKLGALVRIVLIMLWVRRKHRDRKTSDDGIHQTNQSNGSSEHDGINGGIDGEGAEDEFHADSDDDIATELILEAVVKNHGHAFDYPMSKSEKMIRSMQMTEGLWNKAQIEAVQYKWASLTLKLMM